MRIPTRALFVPGLPYTRHAVRVLLVERDQRTGGPVVQVVVDGLRTFGSSWTEIATRLGTTRQAAHQRWGR